jgi:predicted NBD/HSP70 family sugar kinase
MIASGPAIARRAREALEGGGKSVLRDLVKNDVSLITGHTVGEAADAGDGVARKIMQDTLDALAYWLGNIIDLIEPDVIVIGGGVSSTLAPHLPEIRARWKGAWLIRGSTRSDGPGALWGRLWDRGAAACVEPSQIGPTPKNTCSSAAAGWRCYCNNDFLKSIRPICFGSCLSDN